MRTAQRGTAAPVRLDRSATPVNTRLVLIVTCVALATVVSAVASLNVALPSIARETHASQTQLSWIIDSYALTFAALLLPAGALGDRYGRRRVLLAGLALFGAGSAAAMTLDTAGALIAVRTVLGLGAALVMPATLSTVTSTFPQAQRARAVGTWAGVAGASAILGLLSSGLLLEWWSWRSVFALNVVLAVLALLATALVVPESADPDAPSLDWIGAAASVIGLGAVVYAVIEAPTEGWSSARTVWLLLAGGVVLAALVAWELHTDNPLLDPRLFRVRPFALGTLSLTAQFFAFFGFIFLLLQYLQLVLRDSPLRAALSLIPMALGLLPSARVIAPRLAERAGTRVACTLGLVIAAASMAWLSRLDASSSYWWLLAGLIPLGVGMALAMTPATAALTDALPPEKQGVGSAMNDLSRELGGALGIAVLGSVLQSMYRAHLDVGGLPAPIAEHARESLALALHVGGPVAQRAQGAFVDGMQAALLVGAGALLAAGIAVALGLRARDAVRRTGQPDRAVPSDHP